MNEKMMEVRFTFISCILIAASLIPNMTIAKKTILVFVQEFCYSVLVKYMDPKPNLPPSSFYSSLSHLSPSYHVEHFIFYTRTKKKDEENNSISHRLRKKQLPQAAGLFYFSLSGFETSPGSWSHKEWACPVSWDTASTTDTTRISLAWG